MMACIGTYRGNDCMVVRYAIRNWVHRAQERVGKIMALEPSEYRIQCRRQYINASHNPDGSCLEI